MNQDFDFKQVPRNWALCYVPQCPRRDECLRYQICQNAPEGRVYHKCILPTVLSHGDCQHFCPVRKVKAAVGFRNIFGKVLAKDITSLRSEMTAYLGSRSSFFRYQRGELLLMPAQQEWIQRLFQRYGYTDTLSFDTYKDVYIF